MGAGFIIFLQVLILLTGNYAFFNWLTIILCLWAFDDWNFQFARRVLRHSRVTIQSEIRRRLLSVALAGLMLLGGVQVVSLFAQGASAPFARIFGLLAPWQVVNSYGLFAVMTTMRPELIYEGSDDGQKWIEYSFPYKPGDVKRPLPLVAPFQPRLDWQLWFAALDGNYEEDRWTGNLAVRLLQGYGPVLKLLNRSPFSRPPKYIRVALYDYWFTDEAEQRKTGTIWNRRFERLYLPAISLDQLRTQ
jgi:lipase maturation factor 1